MLNYYKEAIERSGGNAFDWLTGQGILLTWLHGASFVFISLSITAIKAFRKYHSWNTALHEAKSLVSDFGYTTIKWFIVGLFVVFSIFFIRDAPTQLTLMTERLTQAQADIRLRDKELDDRDAKRKFRNDVSNVLNDGYLLLNRFPLGNGGEIPEDDLNKWADRVLKVFRENNKYNSYWVRLLDPTPLGSMTNHPQQTPQARAYVNLLSQITNLQKLLKECDTSRE